MCVCVLPFICCHSLLGGSDVIVKVVICARQERFVSDYWMVCSAVYHAACAGMQPAIMQGTQVGRAVSVAGTMAACTAAVAFLIFVFSEVQQ
jgi:uncharacterized protein (UPF0262 family)